MSFRRSTAALIFVGLKLWAVLFQVYRVWIVFAGFTFVVDFLITFEGIISFVVNYYISGFNNGRKQMLIKS